jgi:hypothetical protein
MRMVDPQGSEKSGRPPLPKERWLIAKDAEGGGPEPLTVAVDGGETLPVFCFEEEAEMYLRLAGLEEGWLARPSGCGELVSLLYGPCACVRSVALDPLPEMIRDGTIGLVSLERGRFVDHLMSERSG